MEDVDILRLFGIFLRLFGIFYGHLVYFMAIWYILLPFGIFYCHLVYFTAIWYIFTTIWYILWPFGIFYGHLVYFTAIWYILLPFGIFYCHLVIFLATWYICGLFGIFFTVLVSCVKKNLATLDSSRIENRWSKKQRFYHVFCTMKKRKVFIYFEVTKGYELSRGQFFKGKLGITFEPRLNRLALVDSRSLGRF
jgi:hypothetical protein